MADSGLEADSQIYVLKWKLEVKPRKKLREKFVLHFLKVWDTTLEASVRMYDHNM